MGRETSVVEAANTATPVTKRTLYDLVGNVVSVVDSDGNVTTFAYDADNQLTGETTGAGTAHPESTSDVYDIYGNLIRSFDALGHETDYGYDAQGRETSRTEAVGTPVARTTKTFYDVDGNVVSTLDARGIEIDYAYDKDGRQIAVTQAANTSAPRTTRTFYDADGNVVSTLDGRGIETDYTYDDEGRQVAVTEAANTALARTTTTVYDKDGDVIATIDPRGTETDYTYDKDGRQVAVTEAANTPLARTTTTVYDADGNVVSTINPRGIETDYAYDAQGRQTVVTEGVNTATPRVVSVTHYDADGNVASAVDAKGIETDYTYDPEGRQTAVTLDANTALARTTTTVYDALNRATTISWYDASDALSDTTVKTYDANDNLLTASNHSGATTVAFTYDALNRLSTRSGPSGDALTYGYDANDNRTSVTDSFGGVTTAVYDAFDRVVTILFGGAGQTPLRADFTYTPTDQVDTVTRYADLAGTQLVGTTTDGYDTADRLASIIDRDTSVVTLASFLSSFDAADRLTSETDNGTAQNFNYDGAGQLKQAGTDTYTYDANGNRPMTGYQTGLDNQLLSDGTWNYTYDNEGNRLTKANILSGETWTYGYDNANHLVSAVDRSGSGALIQSIAYSYDALGDRIEEDITPAGGATTVQKFAYDGQNVWSDLDANNALQTRYLRNAATDELIARIGSTGLVAWYLTDRLGSVRDLTDASGALIDTINYDAYGNVTAESNAAAGDRYKFDGEEFDAATGLEYNRARYYDPATGSWVSQDPIGFDAGDANLYRYVGNGPTNANDITGLYEIDVHHYMTYYLALAAGLGKYNTTFRFDKSSNPKSTANLAYMIAWSAQYTDVHSTTQPLSTQQAREKFHFRVDPGAIFRPTVRDSAAANAIADQGIAKNDPILFGIGLHAYEDSWSHEGYGPRLGHWQPYRLFDQGHHLDYPYLDVAKSVDMAKHTYDKILQFAKKNNYKTSNKSFEEFEPTLRKLFSLSGNVFQREMNWARQIGADFNVNPNYYGEPENDDNHSWSKPFLKAASQVEAPAESRTAKNFSQ